MASGSTSISKKQSAPVAIDTEGFKTSLQGYQGEFEEIKNTGILIYDNDSFDHAANMAIRAKGLRAKFEEAFKPVSDSVKQVTKTLKSAVEVFTEPLQKYEDAIRSQARSYLEENPGAETSTGRLQNSRWKLIVKDEEALLKSMVIATNKKGEDGKMYIDIQLNPQIRALFPYNEAKGNALASVVTSAMKIAGCETKQDNMLVLTGDK